MNGYYELSGRNFFVATGTKMIFPAHFHHEAELMYILGGEMECFADGKSFTLGAGDFFFAFPNQVHAYHAGETEEHVIIIFNPDGYGAYRGVFSGNVPKSNVIEKKDLDSGCDAIIRGICAEYDRRGEFSEDVCRGLLSALIGKLLRSLTLVGGRFDDLDSTGRVIRFCMENYRENISLSSVSKSVGVNKYNISRIFSKNIHSGFCDYINSLRVRYAKTELSDTNRKITEIALDSGFENPRSFNRAFLKFTGVSPREYRDSEHKIRPPQR